MDESILTSIKKLLGITEECEDFDEDLIIHINSAFSILNQMGVGEQGYGINDKSSTWDEFINNNKEYMPVKSYVFLKVKLIFDPPLSSAVMECYKANISELEWRLNFSAECKTDTTEVN